VPEDIDEVAVAGALVDSPMNVVKARTVDLYVPAEAEIVIEGYVETDYLEPEAPFGESHGHVNTQEYNGVMEVTAITRRSNAVLTSYLSQVHPNETTEIRAIVFEHGFTEHLQRNLGLRGVVKVRTHRPFTGNRKIVFIVLKRGLPRAEVWRALYGIFSHQRASGKIIIAINDDISPDNLDSVMWALAFRCNPREDIEIPRHKDAGHTPGSADADDSGLLIDATLKGDMPPISLPTQEFMDAARVIWEQKLGLPKIAPHAPWFGYSLGKWPSSLQEEAARAVKGDFWETGRLHAQRRRMDVPMNTEVDFED